MRISDWSSDVCSSDLCGRRYIRSRRPPSLGPPKHLLGLAPLAPRRAFPYRSPRLIRPATGQGSQGMDSGRGGWRILRTATACGAAASVSYPRRSCKRLTPRSPSTSELGRAHVCTHVTNAHLVCRVLLENYQLLTRQPLSVRPTTLPQHSTI